MLKKLSLEEIDNLPYQDILDGKIHQMISVYENALILSQTICNFRTRIQLETVDNVDDAKLKKPIIDFIELDIDKIKDKLQPDMDWIMEVILIYYK
jgi:hypothetical protein